MSDAEPDSVFASKADYQQTKLDHFQEQLDRWVVAPFRILMDDYRGRVGIFIVTVYLLMGTIGPMFVPVPTSNMGPRLIQPFENPNFILGTDAQGRGLLALMVHATPSMLKMMIAGALFGNFMGTTLGIIAGYKGGTVDKAIMTVSDTMGSIPGLPLLLIIVAIVEPRNPFVVGIVLNIQGLFGASRGLRAQVLPLVDEEHVEASRAMGKSTSGILVTEILPHLLPYIFIGFLGGMTGIISASVGLYFLGVLPFTTLNWGVVLNSAYQSAGALYTPEAAHWLIVPLVTITGLTFGLTMLAQAFDQVFNPRVRSRHLGRKQAGEDAGDDEVDVQAAQEQTGMRV
jgi:peptide/nickel transport system permease protein